MRYYESGMKFYSEEYELPKVVTDIFGANKVAKKKKAPARKVAAVKKKKGKSKKHSPVSDADLKILLQLDRIVRLLEQIVDRLPLSSVTTGNADFERPGKEIDDDEVDEQDDAD